MCDMQRRKPAHRMQSNQNTTVVSQDTVIKLNHQKPVYHSMGFAGAASRCIGSTKAAFSAIL